MSRAESRTADDLLTTADLARLWRVNPSRVRQRRLALAAAGRPLGRRIGTTWVYTRDEAAVLKPGRPGKPRASTSVSS